MTKNFISYEKIPNIFTYIHEISFKEKRANRKLQKLINILNMWIIGTK